MKIWACGKEKKAQLEMLRSSSSKPNCLDLNHNSLQAHQQLNTNPKNLKKESTLVSHAWPYPDQESKTKMASTHEKKEALYGGNLDVCSPCNPQFVFGTSWIMIWTWSAVTPICSKACVIPLIKVAFWSSVFPIQVSTITTGNPFTSPRKLKRYHCRLHVLTFSYSEF